MFSNLMESMLLNGYKMSKKGFQKFILLRSPVGAVDASLSYAGLCFVKILLSVLVLAAVSTSDDCFGTGKHILQNAIMINITVAITKLLYPS
jgi:hypothetical protein